MSNLTSKITDKDTLTTFVDKRIAHPMMRRTLDKLMGMIQNPAGAEIALLCGPTGVGKTTLLDILVGQFQADQLPAMQADPGLIPVVSVKAPAPKGPNFSWKDFGVRVLDAIEEPLIEHKVAPLDPASTKNARGNHNTLNVDEICRLVERSLRHRGTKLLMIDEAQHMYHVTTGRRLLDQLDVLKSLSNGGKPVILLTGTYDLLSMFELNGQLLRRTAIFNFPRYTYEQFQEFLVALKAFQTRIQTTEPTDLLKHADYLYKSCLGLIGILKNHLERALRQSLLRHAACIELVDLQETALSETALWKILQEALAGEKVIASMDHSGHSLGAALGMEPMEPEVVKKKPEGRIGLRKQINDPVGID